MSAGVGLWGNECPGDVRLRLCQRRRHEPLQIEDLLGSGATLLALSSASHGVVDLSEAVPKEHAPTIANGLHRPRRRTRINRPHSPTHASDLSSLSASMTSQ
jgi:hypothetical protein